MPCSIRAKPPCVDARNCQSTITKHGHRRISSCIPRFRNTRGSSPTVQFSLRYFRTSGARWAYAYLLPLRTRTIPPWVNRASVVGTPRSVRPSIHFCPRPAARSDLQSGTMRNNGRHRIRARADRCAARRWTPIPDGRHARPLRTLLSQHSPHPSSSRHNMADRCCHSISCPRPCALPSSAGAPAPRVSSFCGSMRKPTVPRA